MNYETILVDTDDAITTITLNRPERLNAWTWQMNDDLVHALNTGNADDYRETPPDFKTARGG